MSMPEPQDDELFRLLLDDLPPERAAELQVWAGSTEARQARLNELRALIAALEQPVTNVDLLPGVETRIERARRPRRPFFVGMLTAAACLTALVIGTQQTADPESDEVRRKGTGSRGLTAQAQLQAFRLGAEDKPEPLGTALAANDGLLFAYSNRGTEPFTHLLIFGIGATGQVYWYFPAWLNEGEDPEALPIQKGELIELHERVSHRLPRGRFVIHAVFARRAIRVSEIERLISTSDAGAVGPLALPETEQQRFMLEVR